MENEKNADLIRKRKIELEKEIKKLLETFIQEVGECDLDILVKTYRYKDGITDIIVNLEVSVEVSI